MATDEQIREGLLKAGVKNLKTYGYPAVTTDNITTDLIYSAFFTTMLEETRGNSKQIDSVVNSLIDAIKENGRKL